jgi:hypothetical protein
VSGDYGAVGEWRLWYDAAHVSSLEYSQHMPLLRFERMSECSQYPLTFALLPPPPSTSTVPIFRPRPLATPARRTRSIPISCRIRMPNARQERKPRDRRDLFVLAIHEIRYNR